MLQRLSRLTGLCSPIFGARKTNLSKGNRPGVTCGLAYASQQKDPHYVSRSQKLRILLGGSPDLFGRCSGSRARTCAALRGRDRFVPAGRSRREGRKPLSTVPRHNVLAWAAGPSYPASLVTAQKTPARMLLWLRRGAGLQPVPGHSPPPSGSRPTGGRRPWFICSLRTNARYFGRRGVAL
jgi:hypothetical protein